MPLAGFRRPRSHDSGRGAANVLLKGPRKGKGSDIAAVRALLGHQAASSFPAAGPRERLQTGLVARLGSNQDPRTSSKALKQSHSTRFPLLNSPYAP